jgi:hypothetical protein
VRIYNLVNLVNLAKPVNLANPVNLEPVNPVTRVDQLLDPGFTTGNPCAQSGHDAGS